MCGARNFRASDPLKPIKIMGDWIGGLLGGFLGGVSNFIGSLVDAQAGYYQGKEQRAHDEYMAGLNQQYNRENMATQYQYQLEQWHRENEYNDPTAVMNRYRNAGLNPRAVFGQGSTAGAGIAGGLSSAPSGSGSMGSASDIRFRTNFAGLTNGISDLARVTAQNRKDDADAQKAYEDAKAKALANAETEFMKENGAWLNKLSKLNADTDIAVSVAYMRKVDSELYDFEHKTDVRNKYLSGQLALKQIDKLEKDMDRIDKLNELTDEEKKLAKSTAEKYRLEGAKIRTQNTFFDKFGFYPPTGSTLESALVGLGAKGIGELAERLGRKSKKVIKPNNPATAEIVKEWSMAKTQKEKDRVVWKAQANAMNYPLSRGIQ